MKALTVALTFLNSWPVLLLSITPLPTGYLKKQTQTIKSFHPKNFCVALKIKAPKMQHCCYTLKIYNPLNVFKYLVNIQPS